MNMAILNKLYEIAFAVWEKMAKVADYGSYTASEIANMLNKEFNFSNEQNEDEKTTVSVGTYTCSFPLKNIFYFVSVFEKLASVGRNARQFVFEESGELLGKATFEVSKGMSELCKFVADDELRPVMNYIILDAANNCLVASDGKKTLEKLSFLKNYGCTFEDSHSRGSIHINSKEHGKIEVGLNWKYEDFAGKHNSIARYYTDKLLKINWNYSMCGGDKSELSLDDFVKALVRRGIISI